MDITSEDKMKKNLYLRTCRTCGTVFSGGPRAQYCPECRVVQKAYANSTHRANKRDGKVREIGSIDICERCGNAYVVKGGLQKYCKNCGRDAWKEQHKGRFVSRNIEGRGGSYIVYVYIDGKRVYIKCTTDRAEAFRLRDLADKKKKSGNLAQWLKEIKSLGNTSTRKRKRKKQERIVIGKTYKNILVLSPAEDGRKPKRYNCQCIRCGKIFTQNGQEVHDNQSIGCPECREKDMLEQRIKKAEKYIGAVFDELEVIGISGIRQYGGRNTIFASCRCSCQNTVDIPLTRLKAGQAKTCGHNRNQQLKKGQVITESAHVNGTLISAIDGRRKTNKNSKTGIPGVSRMQDGKYRAYITFQRKQYHLGIYTDLEDAKKARKIAEEKIYGPFLEWYASAYPEQWEKINKKQPGD